MLLIKITNSGLSQEYSINSSGPITIGSDVSCDVCIADETIESKLLEVKLSSGKVYVKEVGTAASVFINSLTPVFGQETAYHEGDCISLKNSFNQIYIYQLSDVAAPPPFFEDEFQERLSRMDDKIAEKERLIRSLDAEHVKKRNMLSELEEIQKENIVLIGERTTELNALNRQKEDVYHKLHKFSEQLETDKTKSIQLSDFVSRLKDEENAIKNKIEAHNLILGQLQIEKETKSKNVNLFTIELDELGKATKKSKEKLQELADLKTSYEEENRNEKQKAHQLIIATNLAYEEHIKYQDLLLSTKKNKAAMEHDCNAIKNEIDALEIQGREAQKKLFELGSSYEHQVRQCETIQSDLQMRAEESKFINLQNQELKSELRKLEERLAYKKNQIDQTDFQNQDLLRKLSTVNFELEHAALRLVEIGQEEKVQESKIKALREEMQTLEHKADADKKKMARVLEEEKIALQGQRDALLNEIREGEKYKQAILSEQQTLKSSTDALAANCKILTSEKTELSKTLDMLSLNKKNLEEQIYGLRKTAEKFDADKLISQRELAILQTKIADSETLHREKLLAAQSEAESIKRVERAKLVVEREIHLSEVEAYKQKSLIEIESEYRQKLDDVYRMKEIAQAEANEILQTARQIEKNLTLEANLRLRSATVEAKERETYSHNRILEAQTFFKQKESEAEVIMAKARTESSDMLKKAESELLEDLALRKHKIKNFLSMKQAAGTEHLKAQSEQSALRLKKIEIKAYQKLEDVKRRELKKVAKFREEEISRLNEMKEAAMNEFKAEKESTIRKISELRKSQEAELAEKKKSVIDHINAVKMDGRNDWERELKQEKEHFNRTKKERIANATQAVMNVLISQSGNLGEDESALREKINSTLQMTIDGQNADAIHKVGQVLDFNPLNRKKIIPVLKKYSLNFGVPAALAIIMLADIGSVRTAMISKAKVLMKTNNSASELYTNKRQTEWKEKHTYNPALTPGYKATFTDNVIYTTDFEKIMENEAFQNEWILKVHNFLLKDLELSEDIAINYISSEGALIKDLYAAKKELHPQFLDQGLKKMTTLEETHLGWLKQKIVKPENMEKFLAFRKSNFDEFYNKQSVKRDIAAEKK